MLQFFPKELLKNCPKGFNMLPLVKVEGEEKKTDEAEGERGCFSEGGVGGIRRSTKRL